MTRRPRRPHVVERFGVREEDLIMPIANAGYFVLESHRGRGLGRNLVEHSIGEARRLAFDAMQFNLVFESNPARALYRSLGFREVGRIPDTIDGEDAVIYWRTLASENV
jgi:ribosomal protein S18 acetylase RimI-like enzyme